jgi:acyl carrier protein
MGMDSVEMILKTEEVFCIELPDEECGRVIHVGDLYRLVLSKLAMADARIESTEPMTKVGRSRLEDRYPALLPWTREDVWATLVAIIQDQLQVNIEEIVERASFQDDLRCD